MATHNKKSISSPEILVAAKTRPIVKAQSAITQYLADHDMSKFDPFFFGDQTRFSRAQKFGAVLEPLVCHP